MEVSPKSSQLCSSVDIRLLAESAFVGLAAIFILFPIPGLVAKLVQTVQKRRLKETDGRVQSVTESTSKFLSYVIVLLLNCMVII